MKRKITLTLSEEVYKALYIQIGKGYIAKFIEDLITRQLDLTNYQLEEGYKAMMADTEYEKEAQEWIEGEHGECLPPIENEDWGGWNAKR